MPESISQITQICIVVENVESASKHWATVLGVEQTVTETVFPEGIQHVTYGKTVDYKDCRVAKYQLQNIILELIEPGKTPSPWRNFLEKNGQGVFHVCMFVDNPQEIYGRLSTIGVEAPYHVGNFNFGFYSYVASKEQLGLELSINHINKEKNHG
jgi:hypothetical protein